MKGDFIIAVSGFGGDLLNSCVPFAMSLLVDMASRRILSSIERQIVPHHLVTYLMILQHSVVAQIFIYSVVDVHDHTSHRPGINTMIT